MAGLLHFRMNGGAPPASITTTRKPHASLAAAALRMKTHSLLSLGVAAAMLPAFTFAARNGKTQANSAAGTGSNLVEALKAYDKNANHQFDAEELPLLQKAFSTLRGLDKNGNGQIDEAEVASLNNTASGKHRRHGAAIRKADKNANRKFDADEVADLEKILSGSPRMSKVDQNGNGKLDDDEVKRLSRRLAHDGTHRRSHSKRAPAPEKSPSAPAAPPADTPPPEGGKGDADPFLPQAK